MLPIFVKLLQIIHQLTLSYQKLNYLRWIQSGGFLGRFLGLLQKIGFPLMKNVIQTLAKSVLIPLGLTAAASAADAGIHKEILGSGHNTTTLITSNDEMEDITKIVKSLQDSGLSLKEVSETIQNKVKKRKERFLSMLLGTLGASLLGNMLAGEGIHRAGEGFIRAGYGSEGSVIKKKIFNTASSFN